MSSGWLLVSHLVTTVLDEEPGMMNNFISVSCLRKLGREIQLMDNPVNPNQGMASFVQKSNRVIFVRRIEHPYGMLEMLIGPLHQGNFTNDRVMIAKRVD